MIYKGVGRTIAGLALVLAATACDDNPLAEDRERGEYFRLNPSSVAVNAGGTVTVDANVLNRYGAGTNAAVTAEPCDDRISATVDTARSAYEFPERFIITGHTLGLSCLIVRGGGIEDTVGVRVVPASVEVVGIDTLLSGEQGQVQVRFLDVSGAPVTGFTAADVELALGNEAIGVVEGDGTVTARAPGTTTLTATLNPSFGATRSSEMEVTVIPGPFGGTAALGTTGEGDAAVPVVSVTQGAMAFDADTEVQLLLADGSVLRTWNAPNAPEGTISRVIPFGVEAGTLQYNVINIGSDQIAQFGTIELTEGTPAEDPLEPDIMLATPKETDPGETFFGTISSTDTEDLIKFTVTESGTYDVWMDFNDPGSDIDLYLLNNTFSTLSYSENSKGQAEHIAVELEPGTYYIYVAKWSLDADPVMYRVWTAKQ